jgi:hypothetical protein
MPGQRGLWRFDFFPELAVVSDPSLLPTLSLAPSDAAKAVSGLVLSLVQLVFRLALLLAPVVPTSPVAVVVDWVELLDWATAAEAIAPAAIKASIFIILAELPGRGAGRTPGRMDSIRVLVLRGQRGVFCPSG